MSLRKKAGFLAALLSVVLIATACGGKSQTETGQAAKQQPGAAEKKVYENHDEGVYADKVVVGAFLPLSGSLAAFGKSVYEGIQVGVAMVNDKGGVNGRKIEFKAYDDEYKPDKSVANAKLLVERDKVLALVSPFGTATALAAHDYLEKNSVPMVGTLSISDSVTDPPRSMLFALPSPQSTEVPGYVDYAMKKLNAKKFAILYQNDSWGQPSLKFLQEALKKYNLEPVAVQSFERLATDLTSQVVKIKEANPDVVILYALGQQGGLFYKAAEKLDWKPVVFGAPGLNDPPTIKLLGAGAEGNLYVSSSYYPLDGDNAAIVTYRKKFQELFPKSEVSNNSLMGYSAVLVFAEALNKAGPEPTRKKILEALESMTNFDQGIGAPITFQPVIKGQYAHRGQTGVVILKLSGGKFISTGEFIDPVKR